jgi:hypothetical protein
MRIAVKLGREHPPAMDIIKDNTPIGPLTRFPRPYVPVLSGTGSPAALCMDAGEKYGND